MKGEAHIITGSAGVAAVRVMVTNKRGKETFARRILFKNEHATQSLSISTDGGATFMVIAALAAPVEVLGDINSFTIKGSGAATLWSAQMTVA